MLSVPVRIVCISVGKAFYGEIALLGRKNGREITALTVRIMIRLLAVSIVPFTLVICFGPWIFRTFFGPEWAQSGIYARYLCLHLIFRFVYSPISDGIFNVVRAAETPVLARSVTNSDCNAMSRHFLLL